jgi:hypothetical protein
MLQRWLAGHVRAMTRTYRPPTPRERERAVTALRAALAREAHDDHLLRRSAATDDAGRPFTILTDTEHAWGSVLLRTPSDLLIEVPHPGSDRLTARLGLELFHAIPSAALLVAGAHRNQVDVAHGTDSLFHMFAQTLALPEIQLHGFATRTAPDVDAVASPGAGEPGELHRRTEKALVQQGFRVGHHERLAGRTNTQGIAAAANGRPFLHLELAPVLRDRHRAVVVEAITKAVADTRHQQRDQHPDRRGTGRDQERDAEPGQ